MKDTTLRIFLTYLFIFILGHVFSQVKLPALFSDNMVLQQQSDAPIWGKSKPNTKIKIVTSWDNKTYIIDADSAGKWQSIVKTPQAGGPYQITFTNRHKTVKLQNILIGEVWICSGQSNMEMPLAGWGKIFNYEKEIAEANYPEIRLIQLTKKTSTYPLDDISLDTDGWLICSPEAVENFSSTAYFYGRELYNQLNIPIGLIHSSWGGTPIESWTSGKSLNLIPEFIERVKTIQNLPSNTGKQKEIFQRQKKEWDLKVLSKDFGISNNVAVVTQIDYNDSSWQKMNIPQLWEESILPDFDGFVWFRKEIEIPKIWENNDLVLSMGMIDDDDITYFNGIEIGKTTGYDKKRLYEIPATYVKSGKTVIAVRVMDSGGGGGFYGAPTKMYISPNTKNNTRKIDLCGEWKFKKSIEMSEIGELPRLISENPHLPTNIYNAMIAPLIPYSMKGAIWYQGESNVDRAYQYRTLFPVMINDWRSEWGDEFPFYFVQLANFMQSKNQPEDSKWAELREAQLQTLKLHNTGMAVSIDIGDANDIHPKNKQDIGKRLAYCALEKTYKHSIISSGPIYKTYRIEKNKIRLFFENSSSKLKFNGNKLQGFSIAGPDKVFYRADSKIEGAEIVVYSSEVQFPIAVRYAWADNPTCNLRNENGLPASPFRTDDWIVGSTN